MREFPAAAATGPDCDLGEGPVWLADRQELTWVDITACRIITAPGADLRAQRTTTLDRPVGAVAPIAGRPGSWVAAAGDGFLSVDPEVTELARPERGNPAVRMNDGKCDPRGRFWAGSMSEERDRAGSLYRLDPDGTAHRVLDGVGISNGIGWSPDAQLMYFVDTAAGVLDVFDFDIDDGVPLRRRTLVAHTGRAAPDGLAVDDTGAIWVALWDGGAVVRYTPSGQVDTVVPLPVSRPTSCCFGGDTLFITTASVDGEPLSGAVFTCHPDVTGPPPTPYRGSTADTRS